MQRTKIKCEFCGLEISRSNYSRHIDRHKNKPESFNSISYKLEHDGLNCLFCSYIAKTRNGLMTHERVCKFNPNRMLTAYELHPESFTTFCSKDKNVWNKGLTMLSDVRILRAAEKLKERYANNELVPSFLGKHHSEETKLLLSSIAKSNNFGGHFYKNLIDYNGIKLDSSYEVILAESLDLNNIKWERPGRFSYHIDGKLHYYTPDFYLPDYDVYLDPKNDFLIENVNPSLGYKDIDKIKQVELENNIKVFILNKDLLLWHYIKLLL